MNALTSMTCVAVAAYWSGRRAGREKGSTAMLKRLFDAKLLHARERK